MSNTTGLQKYWITACDEQRRVIFNKIITTGSLGEAQTIAENYVPAEHHGSICITDESNNPSGDVEAGLPTFSAAVGANFRRTSHEEDRDALIANLTEMALRSWTARLLAGEARAMSDLQNVVLDRLTDDQAKAIFVQAVTGQGAEAFSALAVKAMYDSCEVESIKTVERMEQIRAEETRMARIERRVWDRHYASAVPV